MSLSGSEVSHTVRTWLAHRLLQNSSWAPWGLGTTARLRQVTCPQGPREPNRDKVPGSTNKVKKPDFQSKHVSAFVFLNLGQIYTFCESVIPFFPKKNVIETVTVTGAIRQICHENRWRADRAQLTFIWQRLSDLTEPQIVFTDTCQLWSIIKPEKDTML